MKDWTVFCVNGKWSSNGKVLDVSEGGMSVDMDHVPEMKQPVILHIRNGKKELTREAVVVWYIKHVPPAAGAMVGLQYM